MKFADLTSEFAPPEVSFEEAARILEEHYSLTGDISLLGGERDRNFHVKSSDGNEFVLKVSGEAESMEAIDLQVCVLEHLGRAGCGASAPRGVPTGDGALYFDRMFDNGGHHVVRLVTFLSGRLLEAAALQDRRTVFALGGLQGRTCRALAGFFHPAARRAMPWDIGNGLAFDETLLTALDTQIRQAVEPHLRRLQEETLPALRLLRGQAIHNDVHAGNVLVDDSGRLSGLIDFGDAMFAPLIQDLAASAASIAEFYSSDCGDALARLEQGFHAEMPLLPEERELFLDATLLRGLLSVELVGFKLGLVAQSDSRDAALADTRRALLTLLSLTNRNVVSGFDLPGADTTLERRKTVLSPTYRLHYDEPLHIVRGEGTLLYDRQGREYLDCYNNVPSVGHGNAHVVEALTRQAATLNTHTRYLHHEIVRYGERLTATMPDELDTCMFVCSGTEANDLAYNIARTVTGRQGALVSFGAYHGNSIGIADLSTEGHVRSDYPPHVFPIDLPDTYRGAFGAHEPELGLKLAANAGAVIDECAGSSYGLAMLMVDAIFDAPGIFTAPPHYLGELFDRVRAKGGLVVVDEVQSGLCRLGDNTWGFQDSGVIPDIVTMGKPMGNGHPLAVVVARREIMETFAHKQHYFNTFGGNPVTAAVGNAVLDVVEADDVRGSVKRVGEHLKSRLLRLADRYEAIGDVRGKGLFLGIDLVSDRQKRTPWSDGAHQLVNRLRHKGVLVSVNGMHDNVIKIRPPLIFSMNDADRLVQALDEELSAGEPAARPRAG